MEEEGEQEWNGRVAQAGSFPWVHGPRAEEAHHGPGVKLVRQPWEWRELGRRLCRLRALAGRRGGPSGQEKEWLPLHVEREDWGNWTGRKGRNVAQGTDSGVEILGLGWRGVGEILRSESHLGVRVNRIAMGRPKLIMRR